MCVVHKVENNGECRPEAQTRTEEFSIKALCFVKNSGENPNNIRFFSKLRYIYRLLDDFFAPTLFGQQCRERRYEARSEIRKRGYSTVHTA